jgi:hypothetical protein
MGKSYIESFLSKAPWANVLERTGGFPLDRSSMFDSFEDAEKYAKGEKTNPDKRGLYGTSYIGQIITVYENDKVIVYKINKDRELEEIGGGSGRGTVVVSNYNDIDTVYKIDADAVGQLIYCIENNKKGLYMIGDNQSVIKILGFSNDNNVITIDCGTF